MTTTLEPQGKLDAASAVNGPEGESCKWESVSWLLAEDNVRRLRQRIFTASQAGDLKRVRNLQKLMLRSRSNAVVSVRRVTELNAGRKTAGIDGEVALTPEAKGDLADWVQRRAEPWTARPVRRVYIPKASGKQRPLGIPVIADRALQAVVASALEPEWEARFEPRSYGFRPAVAAMTRSRPSFRPARAAVAPARAGPGYSTRTWRRRSTGSTTITFSACSALSRPGS